MSDLAATNCGCDNGCNNNGCGNNGCGILGSGNNNCLLWLIVLLFLGNNNSDCGCGCTDNTWILIILLLFFGGNGNGCGCGCGFWSEFPGLMRYAGTKYGQEWKGQGFFPCPFPFPLLCSLSLSIVLINAKGTPVLLLPLLSAILLLSPDTGNIYLIEGISLRNRNGILSFHKNSTPF